jgi:hypothetical protein
MTWEHDSAGEHDGAAAEFLTLMTLAAATAGKPDF